MKHTKILLAKVNVVLWANEL